MDARELTKVYEQIRSEQQDMKRTVDYLEQECAKLRRIVEDLKIDVKMMQRRN